LSPSIIFVNGPPCVGKTYFTNKFKNESISVMELNNQPINDRRIAYIHKYFKSNEHTSAILKANISDGADISKIFSKNFTYVFIYPNSARAYKERLLNAIKTNKKINGIPDDLVDLFNEIKQKEALGDVDDLLTELTTKIINNTRLIYDDHLKLFNNKILLILN